jgi:hypothetical protein
MKVGRERGIKYSTASHAVIRDNPMLSMNLHITEYFRRLYARPNPRFAEVRAGSCVK